MLVGFSHQKVGQAAARYLKQRGTLRPAVITPSDRRAQARAQAFIKAFGAGVEIPIIAAESPANLGDGRRALGELLAQHPDTDAIFCGADILALGVLMEAAHRGIAVPAQLRVVGYGDQAFAKDTTPALTTIRIDGTGIGKLAASLLIDRIEHGDEERRTVDVGFTLVERDSA
jgi:LacI family gluconate utilization system Gnt-I transcriptional repressor